MYSIRRPMYSIDWFISANPQGVPVRGALRSKIYSRDSEASCDYCNREALTAIDYIGTLARRKAC